MIKFRKKLYLGPSVKDVNKSKWKIKTGRGQFDIYLLVYNHDSEKLEYFHNALFKQKAFYHHDYDVVGLGGNTEECIEIIEQIVKETFDIIGEYNISKYLGME